MVNFEDGQLVKGAYVVIDGKEYPVIMPQYSGNTPITSENLNKSQIDLKNEIKELQSVVLYESQNANIGTNITLTDDAFNYKKIIVEAVNIDEESVCIIPEIIEPDGKKFPIITTNTDNTNTKTYYGNSIWQIEGNEIKRIQDNVLTTFHKDGATKIERYNNVKITKVLGFKF